MSRLTKFEDYRDRYSDSYVLEKTDDGILLMRMHTDGGPVNWSKAVQATPNLFADVAGDRDVHIVIYTGTGDNFNANWRPKGEELEAYAAKLRAAPQRPAEDVEESGWFGRNRHNNMLEIDAIMIAAVNGPVTIHSNWRSCVTSFSRQMTPIFRTSPTSFPTCHPATVSRIFGREL